MAAPDRSVKDVSGAPAPSPERGSSQPGTASATIALAIRSAEGALSNRSAALWSPLAAVRSTIDAMFADMDVDVLDAIRMTAGELGENVLKYGDPIDGIAGQLAVSRTPGKVEIRTSNSTNATRAAHLLELIDLIAKASDLRSRFIDRMAQIIEHPEQHSTALGLLRIGYEGRFELTCSYDGATMTVICTRSLP